MKLTRPTRIALGIVTFIIAIYPLVAMILAFGAMFAVPFLSGQTMSDRLQSFMTASLPLFFILLTCLGLFQLALEAFYIVHIIKNREGAEIFRILIAIGMYLLPFLVMPIYYLIYIWPDSPPDWALEAN